MDSVVFAFLLIGAISVGIAYAVMRIMLARERYKLKKLLRERAKTRNN